MAIKYEAYTRLGEKVVGVLHTDSEDTAYGILEGEDLIPYRVSPVRRGGRIFRLFPTFLGPSSQNVIDFTRQLAALLNAGIPLRRSLGAQRDQVSNAGLRSALGEIVEAVEEGRKFSEAVADHPHIFADFYVRMLKVGEATGGLPFVLNQIADALQRRKTVSDRIRGSLVYPGFTLLVALGAASVLVIYSLPALTDLLSQVGGELPASTRLLIVVSNIVDQYAVRAMVGALVLAILIVGALRLEIGRTVADTVLLRMPVLGRVIVANNMFALTSILSTLLKAGMSPVEALQLTRRGMANAYYRRKLGVVVERVEQGVRLGAAFGADSGFPSIVSQAVVTGETRGRLADTLSGLMEYYEDVTTRSAGGIAELIQPVIILFVSAVVGFVAISVISGIYSTLGAIQ